MKKKLLVAVAVAFWASSIFCSYQTGYQTGCLKAYDSAYTLGFIKGQDAIIEFINDHLFATPKPASITET